MVLTLKLISVAVCYQDKHRLQDVVRAKLGRVWGWV